MNRVVGHCGASVFIEHFRSVVAVRVFIIPCRHGIRVIPAQAGIQYVVLDSRLRGNGDPSTNDGPSTFGHYARLMTSRRSFSPAGSIRGGRVDLRLPEIACHAPGCVGCELSSPRSSGPGRCSRRLGEPRRRHPRGSPGRSRPDQDPNGFRRVALRVRQRGDQPDSRRRLTLTSEADPSTRPLNPTPTPVRVVAGFARISPRRRPSPASAARSPRDPCAPGAGAEATSRSRGRRTPRTGRRAARC